MLIYVGGVEENKDKIDILRKTVNTIMIIFTVHHIFVAVSA